MYILYIFFYLGIGTQLGQRILFRLYISGPSPTRTQLIIAASPLLHLKVKLVFLSQR